MSNFFNIFPDTANQAANLVTCHAAGTCSFCSLMAMINGIVEWLIIILTLFSVLIIAYAGFLLVFSRGDRSALETGKKLFFNSIIGILIMLAGWTIVDTTIKLTAGGNLGMWNEVQCGAGEFAAGEANYSIKLRELEYEAGVPLNTTVTLHTGGHVGVDGNTSNISACDESAMVSMNFLGQGIRIHQNLVPSLNQIDSQWRARGGNSAYEVRSVGGYNCRRIANSNRMSYHSYGVAVDINASTNPHLGSECRTDMPPWFRELFTSRGWGWGCNWSSSKDAMHFSKASGEGGDGRY